ncbi:hypothetical protein BC829DRAFT_394894 [Chytridium lagenaria]|nr:hypothetical protein BC829DRAFT_394894 [Chytridium lagenaria]
MAVWFQKTISLKARSRGCHLVTSEITSQMPELSQIKIAWPTFFSNTPLPHVRKDMEMSLNNLAPESETMYIHADEGLDDMPGHVKSSLMGVSLNVPVTNGRLNLGDMAGHRNHGGSRRVVITVQGTK